MSKKKVPDNKVPLGWLLLLSALAIGAIYGAYSNFDVGGDLWLTFTFFAILLSWMSIGFWLHYVKGLDVVDNDLFGMAFLIVIAVIVILLNIS